MTFVNKKKIAQTDRFTHFGNTIEKKVNQDSLLSKDDAIRKALLLTLLTPTKSPK